LKCTARRVNRYKCDVQVASVIFAWDRNDEFQNMRAPRWNRKKTTPVALLNYISETVNNNFMSTQHAIPGRIYNYDRRYSRRVPVVVRSRGSRSNRRGDKSRDLCRQIWQHKPRNSTHWSRRTMPNRRLICIYEKGKISAVRIN